MKVDGTWISLSSRMPEVQELIAPRDACRASEPAAAERHADPGGTRPLCANASLDE